MGFLNNFNLLKGGRTPAPHKTYVTALVKDKGTVALSGTTVTFTNLEVELDGNAFKQTTALDISTLGTAVVPGKVYGVFAVPKYNEPVSKSAAETAGLNYYVSGNERGESVAYRFFPSSVEASVAVAGGLDVVTKKVLGGFGTDSDIAVYNYYYETIEKFRDPRYTIQPLMPVGYDLVLGELVYIDNSAKENAFFTKSEVDFRLLTAQLGELKTFRKIVSTAEATARYSNFLHLIKSAKQYDTKADALVDTNGTNITPDIKAADVANTSYTFAAGKFFAVNEYTIPSTTDMGQTFAGYAVRNWLDKQTSSLLGRINPVYLDNQSLTGTVRIGIPMPFSRLTYYADPLSLARVTVGGTVGSINVSNLIPSFDTGIY
jgi:hypothetical protein